MKSKSIRLLSVFSFVVLACSRGGPAVDMPHPDDDVPVTIVSAEALDSAPVLQPREDLRILPEADTILYTSISSLAVAGDGGVWALDGQASTVIGFDADGRALTRLGGPGDGPGELRDPRQLALLPDAIVVLDTRGLSRFAYDGAFIDRVSIEPPRAIGGPGRIPPANAIDAAGDILLGRFRRLPERGRPKIFRDTLMISAVDPGTGVAEDPFVLLVSADFHKVRLGSAAVRLSGSPAFASSADGHAFVTHADAASIDVISLDDRSRTRLRLDPVRARTSAEDIAASKRAFATFIVGIHPDMSIEEAERRGREDREIPHARYVPVVGNILATPDGAIFVRRLDVDRESERNGGDTHWIFLERDGRPTGSVRLPARFEPMAVRRDAVIGIEKDSLDVQSIVRYRLRSR